MTTSIKFNSGINLVCFNSTESFSKLLSSYLSKINTISSLDNNLINTSIVLSIGGYPIDHANTLLINNFEYRFT